MLTDETNSLLLLALFPIIGALIGWVTNRLAIKMLFRPRRPWYIFGILWQGLIPRRQADIAARVGQIVEEEILQKHVLREEIKKLPIKRSMEEIVDRMIEDHLVPRLREIPLLGSFINDRAIDMLRGNALMALEKELPKAMDRIGSAAEEHIQIRPLVEEKILAFDLEKLESIVLSLAQKEFRNIEILGAVLGGIVGFAQAGIVILSGL